MQTYLSWDKIRALIFYKTARSGADGRYCATGRKVAGSIYEGIIDIYHCLLPADPGVDSTSNRNEYQEYILRGKGCRCLGLTTLPSFHLQNVLKSWSFAFLEPSGRVQPCTGLDRNLFLFAFNILYCASSLWRSFVKRKLERCYKFHGQWFPVVDHLLHMVHFGKMRRNAYL